MFEDFSKVNHATMIQLLTFIKKEWEGEEEEEKHMMVLLIFTEMKKSLS